ncbi:hypothetical protein DFH08DRAFT_939165 [Mycena albidolilacea]|uniref:Uncharacterized protein n=1 Tax=Mycena albidolilacea TaxID=1033008 RepID=A0AAD6ZSJ9_9AGAR|nr:hypothetical protein DFH08DRAFT_939165 [Mycena albidolilacea]
MTIVEQQQGCRRTAGASFNVWKTLVAFLQLCGAVLIESFFLPTSEYALQGATNLRTNLKPGTIDSIECRPVNSQNSTKQKIRESGRAAAVAEHCLESGLMGIKSATPPPPASDPKFLARYNSSDAYNHTIVTPPRPIYSSANLTRQLPTSNSKIMAEFQQKVEFLVPEALGGRQFQSRRVGNARQPLPIRGLNGHTLGNVDNILARRGSTFWAAHCNFHEAGEDIKKDQDAISTALGTPFTGHGYGKSNKSGWDDATEVTLLSGQDSSMGMHTPVDLRDAKTNNIKITQDELCFCPHEALPGTHHTFIEKGWPFGRDRE